MMSRSDDSYTGRKSTSASGVSKSPEDGCSLSPKSLFSSPEFNIIYYVDETTPLNTASQTRSSELARTLTWKKWAKMGATFVALSLVVMMLHDYRPVLQGHRAPGVYTSLWHDIPLRPSNEQLGVFNFVVEIPLHGGRAKRELQKTIPGNPIVQDTMEDGSPRFYSYGDPFFNYGFIPQTWEDPILTDQLGNSGDNDPLDVMEMGSLEFAVGSVVPSRVIGALTLIDQGEMDTKIIAISLADPDADKIHSMDDLETVKPGITDQLVDWLKMYKTTDGKPANTLVSDAPLSVYESMHIIDKTHKAWLGLCISGDDHGQEFWLEASGCSSKRETNLEQ